MFSKHNLLGLIISLVVAYSAVATERIESVTVFPDRATVTRHIEQPVTAGDGELVQADLPVGLMRDSVRITAQGPDGFRLGGYALATRRGSEQVDPRARQLSERIESLQDERRLIDAAVQSRDLQLALLRSFTSVGTGESGPDPQALRATLQLVGEGSAEVLEQKHALGLEQRRLDREIERLQRELADLGQQQRDTTELRVRYTSPQAGEVQLAIEYTVSAASWRPVYEWWLDTANGRLDIVQFAEVRQNTGEDWAQAELALSLAQPATGGRLPELRPWWVDIAPPQPPARQLRSDRAASAPMMAEALMDAPMGAAPGWEAAELSGTPYSQQYRVAGRQSIASDNQPRRFHLADYTLDAELSARTVPRRQATAWLYAQAEFEGAAPLPPGSVTLYQDRTLIGQIAFGGAVSGATLASSFGTDERIEIDYQLTADERASEGMIRRSTRLTREFTISAVNRHERPIALTVLDQMPVSRDERLNVELTSATTTPDQRDVDDKPGILAWERELAPGEEARLTIGYRLVHPDDLSITGW